MSIQRDTQKIWQTKEAFYHYGACLAANLSAKDFFAKRCDIARATNSKPDAVRRWFKMNEFPKGERLIRLRRLLLQEGYRLEETERLSSGLLDLAVLVCNNQVTIDELAREFGVTRDTVLSYFHGTEQFLQAREKKIEEIIMRHLSRETSGKENEPSAAQQITESCHLEKGAILEILASQLMALAPLLDAVLSGAFSADDRRAFRKKLGQGKIFAISNAMNSLCSEKTKELVEERDKQ